MRKAARIIGILGSMALVAALAWFAGTILIGRAIEGVADRARGEGWDIAYAGPETTGFPTELRTVLFEPDLTHQPSGWGWQAETLRFDQSVLRPQHVTATLPPSQVLRTPFGPLLAETSDAMLSTEITPSRRAELVHLRGAIGPSTLSDGGLWSAALDQGFARLDRIDRLNRYRFEAGGTALSLPDRLRGQWDPTGVLPPVIDSVEIAGHLETDRPISPAERQARPTALDLERARIAWGDMVITAEGQLDIDANGFPDGTINLRIDNWRPLFAMAEARGIVGPQNRDMVTFALTFLSGEENGVEVLVLPIEFADGRAGLLGLSVDVRRLRLR